VFKSPLARLIGLAAASELITATADFARFNKVRKENRQNRAPVLRLDGKDDKHLLLQKASIKAGKHLHIFEWPESLPTTKLEDAQRELVFALPVHAMRVEELKDTCLSGRLLCRSKADAERSPDQLADADSLFLHGEQTSSRAIHLCLGELCEPGQKSRWRLLNLAVRGRDGDGAPDGPTLAPASADAQAGAGTADTVGATPARAVTAGESAAGRATRKSATASGLSLAEAKLPLRMSKPKSVEAEKPEIMSTFPSDRKQEPKKAPRKPKSAAEPETEKPAAKRARPRPDDASTADDAVPPRTVALPTTRGRSAQPAKEEPDIRTLQFRLRAAEERNTQLLNEVPTRNLPA